MAGIKIMFFIKNFIFALKMAQENVVFQQRTNSKGGVEFRTKFGRQKAMVYRKHDQFFYVDIYDNRPGRTDRIGLGLDELDQLIILRAGLDSMKQCFPEVSLLCSLLYPLALNLTRIFY